LLISLIIASPLNGYSQDAVPIEKGKPAPFSGVLLTTKRAKQIETELLEKDALKKIHSYTLDEIKLYKDNARLEQEKNDILIKQNLELVKANQRTRTNKTIRDVGLVTLGIGLVIIAIKGAQALK